MIKIVALLGSLAFMIIFYLIRQYGQVKAAKNLRKAEVYRYLTIEEKHLLEPYISSINNDYEVRIISGACYKGHSEFDKKEIYYTIGGLEITFPFKIQQEYTTDNNIVEIATIGDLNLVISINNIGLALAHLHNQAEEHRQDDWQKGVPQHYHSTYVSQNITNDGQLKHDIQQAQNNENYTIVSQRDMTKEELQFIKLPFYEDDNIRSRRFSDISCIILLIILMTIIFMRVEKTIYDLTYHLIIIALFSLLFLYLQRRWRMGLREPINRINGYITDIDREKKQLQISKAIWCSYPPFWDEFIPKKGTFVNAEIKVNSKEIVVLNHLSLQKEADSIGVVQYFSTLLWYLGVVFIGSIVLYFISNDRDADKGVTTVAVCLLVGINLLFLGRLLVKWYYHEKRQKGLQKYYNQQNFFCD